MYLGFKKFNKVRYLCLIESYRAQGHNSPQNRVIHRFFKEELIPPHLQVFLANKDWKTAVARQLSLLPDQERDSFLEMAATQQKVGDILEPEGQLPVPLSGTANFNKVPLLRYGHLLFKKIWDHEFGLRNKIDYMQKQLTDITTWKINDLAFYLATRKAIEPTSYFDAHADKCEYLYCPWERIRQDNFYRGLDFLFEHGEDIMSYAVRHHLAAEKRKIRVAFFDCTNTWFETPYDDLTWAIIRFRREVSEDLERQGASAEDIAKYLESSEFDEALSVRLALSKDDILRMRGKSKEGRYAQPLVTVALAIDQIGFPIDCKVFAGNLHELHSIAPTLQSLKDKYNVNDVYFAADRGLNSTESLCEIKLLGLGFVVAQSVIQHSNKRKQEMLDLAGYQRYTFDGDDFVAIEGPVDKNCFRFKVCDYTRVSRVKIKDDGLGANNDKPRWRKVTINCKIIYTFSPERYKRDMAELSNDKKRAMQAVQSGESMGNPYKAGWRALVETDKEQAQGNDKTMYVAKGLKTKVIEAREEVAGYYAVVYEHPANAKPEDRLDDLQILSTYHKLVRIEDCCRIMKSRFSLRPVYVWKKSRIIGHCYLSVLALMLIKSLQLKVEALGVHMSVNRICEVLSQATVGLIGNGDFDRLQLINMGIKDKTYHPSMTGKGGIQDDVNDVDDLDAIARKSVCQRADTPDDLDLLLTAVGLKPLKMVNTMGDVKRCLSLQPVPNSTMVSAKHMEYLRAAAYAAKHANITLR